MSTTYKPLFEISIFHGYFLNSGETEFNDMPEAARKKILGNYAFEKFIEIAPTRQTAVLLKNHAIISRQKSGTYSFGVKADPEDFNKTFIDISPGLRLDFVIRIKDFFFENYTELNYPKEKMLYLGNYLPEGEPALGFSYIPLFDDNDFVSDRFLVSEATATMLSGTLKEEKPGIYGMLSLKIRGDKDELSILTHDGKIPASATRFKVHFNNRKTYWKYIRTNGAFQVETSSQKPLTQNGFVEIDHSSDFTTNPPEASRYEYPNPSVKTIKKTAGKTYSEIFI